MFIGVPFGRNAVHCTSPVQMLQNVYRLLTDSDWAYSVMWPRIRWRIRCTETATAQRERQTLSIISRPWPHPEQRIFLFLFFLCVPMIILYTAETWNSWTAVVVIRGETRTTLIITMDVMTAAAAGRTANVACTLPFPSISLFSDGGYSQW